MSRIVGIVRFDGKKPDKNTLIKMGKRYKNVVPTMLFLKKNIALGVFEWADDHKTVDKKKISGFSDEDGCIAIDGRIFYLDKKTQKKYGSLDKTSSAQILYKTYWKEGLKKIFSYNSSFTSVIVDSEKKQLIISKDRLGFVPLFVYKDKDKMIFASEIKAILAHPEVKVTPNIKALGLYCFHHYRLAFNYEETFFNEIKPFRPAKSIVFDLNIGKEQFISSWDFVYKPKTNLTLKEAKKEFLELTQRSIKERLNTAPENRGFFMSGGVDSPSVVALACINQKSKVEAFSAFYPKEGKINSSKELCADEYSLIKVMLDYFSQKINWHPVCPKAEDLMDWLSEIMERYDQPIVTVTAYSFYQICKAAKEAGITTLFTGDGPDHLLAGLYETFYYYFADLEQENKKDILEHEVFFWSKYHNHPMFPKNKEVLAKEFSRCIDFSIPGKIKGYSWYHPEIQERYKFSCNKDFKFIQLEDIPIAPSPTKSYLINSLYQYIYYTGSPAHAFFEDIILATFGLETRALFYTKEIHEYCWNLPEHLMIKDGVFKVLIREAMKGILPNELRNNVTKTGFNAPTNIWFRQQLYSPLKKMIESPNFLAARIYDKKKLLEVLEEHRRGEVNHMMFLWQALSTELWLKKYFPDFLNKNDRGD